MKKTEKKSKRGIRIYKVLAAVIALMMVLTACSGKEADRETSDSKIEWKTGSSSTETTSEKTESKKDSGSITFDSDNTTVTVTFSEEADYTISGEARFEYEIAPSFEPPIRSGETYEAIDENGYYNAYLSPLSTFSIDVDTAGYSNVRRFLQDKELPPADAVKIEEMINYFDYDYSQPRDGDPFSITTEVGPCPWNEDHNIAMIGLQGQEIEMDERKKTNLVFLLDVSGSMDSDDKLPLLKEAFEMLVEELGENDKVSIVVYAGASGVVLEGATGEEKNLILKSLRRLDAGGSTAGAAGIELAYEVAKDHFVYNGNNRVILATDGDFNVGLSSQRELEKFIEKKREEDIFLSVLGFGTGNTNFVTMETLADKGNGMFAYIDSVKEAEKVLVEELTGTLYTIAKDVKIQVEFNPNLVKSYRLIGYENRILDHEDFNDDKVDAGDIGAGHRVTALYEVELYGDGEGVDDLRYQTDRETVPEYDELMFVKLRYKHPMSDSSQLIERAVERVKLYDEVSDDYRFAVAVAEFGLILRQSEYMEDASFDHIYEALVDTRKAIEDEYKLEFLSLVGIAQGLIR